ncbi:YqhG family protein [Aciduricibacillus chroicocephali]|uniref:YqhG family protein n=1 Tax=Aciduricibacillus chroicocephali TaxID=3054939 RepID=A0ABY9KRM2_9BACI|nr:YqhG family protein [Bacillaceae bacterium 44XB]
MNIQAYLERYFIAHSCEVTKKTNSMLEIKLTEERDKALMNRPFYWQYVKSTGAIGKPFTLNLHTDKPQEDTHGEYIYLGSPRLQQIFNDLRQNEKLTRQFQLLKPSANTALFPWLLVNFKLIYEGKHRKEELFSLGINLVNGEMRNEMMDAVSALDFSLSIGDLCHTISPVIQPSSGFNRIEKLLQAYVDRQDHSWADHSLKSMQEEIDLLKHFIGDKENMDVFQRELAAIKSRYDPKITMDIINAGMLYLTGNALAE